jgi:hypothetical protein
MTRPKANDQSVSTFDTLFPHRVFPPYVALEHVLERIGQVLRRQRDSPPDLERLFAPLADIAERVTSAASGELTLPRWYRRIVVSVRRCHQAKVQLPRYVRAGAMTVEESNDIGAAIDRLIDRLHEAIARADLPEATDVCSPSVADGLG